MNHRRPATAEPVELDVTSLYDRRADHRWERTSVGDVLERLTWSRPDHEAIVARPGAFAHPGNARLTYRQADELANQVANTLLDRGLARGDRVLMFCENSVEAYVFKIGIAKAGLVCVPVNPMLAPDVIAYLIGRVEPRFALVDAELWPRAESAFAETGLDVNATITLGGDPVAGSVSFAELVADAPTGEPDVRIHGDDIWEIMFTSGTTAMPKGVMLSHSYSHLAASGFALTLSRGLHIEDELRLCAFLPVIYHIADQIFTLPAFFSGGTLILGRRPDPEGIAAAVSDERATALWAGSPAMLGAFADVLAADRERYDAGSLAVAIFGWTSLAPAVLDQLRALCAPGFQAIEIFGQTEAIACHRFWPDKWADVYAATAPAINYVGVPSPLLASDVVDPDGASLRDTPGVAGEAVYRSPVLTAGYYRDEEATRAALRGGWFHSGDSCAYDEQGLRTMVDRYKDIVKSGGENVSSLRVEAVLVQHPAVLKAAVVGLPHERWGEAVTAFVVRAPGDSSCEDDLMSHCRERLAGFERPKRCVFVDQLPETVGGKVLKYRLRAEHAALYG